MSHTPRRSPACAICLASADRVKDGFLLSCDHAGGKITMETLWLDRISEYRCQLCGAEAFSASVKQTTGSMPSQFRRTCICGNGIVSNAQYALERYPSAAKIKGWSIPGSGELWEFLSVVHVNACAADETERLARVGTKLARFRKIT